MRTLLIITCLLFHSSKADSVFKQFTDKIKAGHPSSSEDDRPSRFKRFTNKIKETSDKIKETSDKINEKTPWVKRKKKKEQQNKERKEKEAEKRYNHLVNHYHKQYLADLHKMIDYVINNGGFSLENSRLESNIMIYIQQLKSMTRIVPSINQDELKEIELLYEKYQAEEKLTNIYNDYEKYYDLALNLMNGGVIDSRYDFNGYYKSPADAKIGVQRYIDYCEKVLNSRDFSRKDEMKNKLNKIKKLYDQYLERVKKH